MMMNTTKIRVPKLRFPGFEGEWEEASLEDLAKIYDGTHQTPTYVQEGVPFLSVEHLTANQFKKTKYISEDVFEKESKRTVIEKGDVLMTRIGDIGTSKYINWDIKASFYVSLALIKPYRIILGSYLSYLIDSEAFQRELWKRTIHVAFPKKINLGEIGKCATYFSSLSEQQKIASFLTSVDTKIEALTKKKELLEQYKKGMMQKLFSQEIRFKNEEGNEYPEWEERRLGEVFDISAGGDVGKLNFSKVKTEIHCIPVYANSLRNRGLYGYADKATITKDSVTITGRGDVGYAEYRLKPFVPVVRLLVLLPKENVSVIFFKNAINALDIHVESTGVPQLTAPQVSKYKVAYPNLNEQKKIADFLSAIDTKIELVDKEIEKVKDFKKGLLQQMFV